jgi:CRP/FNR family transcriptional regulator, cyclic AMP receptor protein
MTKDVERYCEILASAPFFETFEEEALRAVVEACEPKRLAPREALWAVGKKGDAAFFLIDGCIERSYRSHIDGQRVAQFNTPGQVLGLSHLAKDWTHGSAATALENTELLRLTQKSFEALFDQGQPAAYRLIDKLAADLVHEMRDANRRLHDVFGNPAETLRTLRRRVRRT